MTTPDPALEATIRALDDARTLLAERDHLAAENQRLRDTIQAVLDRADQYDRQAGRDIEFDPQPVDIVASFRRIALGVSGE